MRVRFELQITEDDHPCLKKLTRTHLKDLGEDIAGLVSGDEMIEGNAVECVVAELVK
jgi:hypothetical protein